MDDRDLKFIVGDFLETALPVEKAYLLRYFTTRLQRQFIRYIQVFGDWEHFGNFTGHVCHRRTLQLMQHRVVELEAARAVALESMDFEGLERIEKGMYPVKPM